MQPAAECAPAVLSEVRHTEIRHSEQSAEAAPNQPPPGRCEAELAFARGQLATYEGHPQDWEGVPESYSEQAMASLLSERWEDVAELHGLHCEEYPCIAEATLLAESERCCRQAMERLPQELERLGRTQITQGEDGAMHFWVAFGSPERWGDAERLRTDWRVDQLLEEYSLSIAEE
ncbi:MAG: hypothetical protein VX899_15260 [Myxococcota bacterium]|nr:hypothetical protein [Myxococcota bacterium]